MSVFAENQGPGNKVARPGRVLAFCLCFAALPLVGDKAFCAVPHREIHGCWVIDLTAAEPSPSRLKTVNAPSGGSEVSTGTSVGAVTWSSPSQESLAAYFGTNDEQDNRAKAAALAFSFDTQKMRFGRVLSGKKEMRNIARIERRRDKTRRLWFQGIKFPDDIKTLPDGRLQYGSDWGRPWMFILRRRTPGTEKPG